MWNIKEQGKINIYIYIRELKKKKGFFPGERYTNANNIFLREKLILSVIQVYKTKPVRIRNITKLVAFL